MRRKQRIIPMPTEEDKQKARLKAAAADPLVWAMKSVDDEFPDEREKDAETVRAEAAVEATEVPEEPDEEIMDDLDDDVTPESQPAQEIKAEGKTTVPMGDGALTMEVTPMRQDVSNVAPEEVKTEKEEAPDVKPEPETTEKKTVTKVKKVAKVVKSEKSDKSDNHKTQVKLTSLESKQKKMMFAMGALILVALGSVAFGVVSMIRQNQAVENLENQIVSVSNGGGDEIDDEYIYLRDWGLKIKIISGLTNVNYNYVNDDYAEVLIWGSTKSTDGKYVPDFAKQNKNSNPLGTVVRVPRYERAAAGRLIWYDDYYNYYYQGPSGVPEVSEDEMSWWVESYLLVKEMLTNADNYSAIDEATVGQQ